MFNPASIQGQQSGFSAPGSSNAGQLSTPGGTRPSVAAPATASLRHEGVPPPPIPDHELIRLIGRGSYGEVWLARNVLGALRAVKFVHRAKFDHDRPFEREFRGIQKFEPISHQHEGLVDILHVGRGEGYYFYVMELADDANTACGVTRAESSDAAASSIPHSALCTPHSYVPRTLRAEIQRRGRLPVAECVAIAGTLTDALRHLHEHGLVHRDIKPSNIIFVNGAPKLADVGLVADIGEAKSFVGTTGFIPPEGPGTPQADLYSLGKVLYEIGTGKDRQDFPLLPGNLRELPDAEALVEFNEILLNACADHPKQRFRSAAEMRADLALLQGGRSVRRYHLVERRLALLTRFGLVITLLLLLASGLFWAARTQARHTAGQLYTAELSLAMEAWENGNLMRANELLEHQRHNLALEPGFEWRLLRQLGRESEPRMAWSTGQGRIPQLAWSREGRRLFSAGADGTIAIWDAATGQKLAMLTNHSALVTTLAVSPDGRMLATGSRDRRVLVWDLDTLARPRYFLEHTNAVRTVVFSPDGSMLASGGEDWRIVLRAAPSGRVLCIIPDTVSVEKLAFSPDSRILAAFGNSTKVRFWKVTAGKFKPLPPVEPHKAYILDGTFAPPDGKSIATTSFDGTVKFWDFQANRSLVALGRGAPTHALAFSPDGKWLGVTSYDSLVRLWDTESRQLVSTLRGHAPKVASLAMAPDGQTLATGSGNGMLRLWTLAALPEIANTLKHSTYVNSLAFSRDGRHLLSVDVVCHTLRWWEVGSRRQLQEFRGTSGWAWCVALARDGRTAVVGGIDHNVRQCDLQTRHIQLFPQVHSEAVESLAFSPDDWLLASASRDGTVCLWEVPSRQLLRSFPHGNALVRSVVFSVDGRYIITGGSDGKVRLWTTHQPALAGLLDNHTQEIRALAVSRDGRLLATGGENALVVVWDLYTRRERMRLEGHTAPISALAFSPDGHTLASGSWDSTVKFWRVELAHEALTIREHTGEITAVAFTEDGATLASASADATVRLWDTAKREK